MSEEKTQTEPEKKEVVAEAVKTKSKSRSRSQSRRSRSSRNSSSKRSRSRSRSRRHRSRSRSSRRRSRSRRRRSNSSRRRSYSRSRSRSGGRYRSRSRSHRQLSPDPEGYRLHVADLDENARKKDLERIFMRFGPLKEIWLASYAPFYAFVVYRNRLDAQDACEDADGADLCGRRIRVTYARPRHVGPRQRYDKYRDDYSTPGRR